MRGVNGLVAGCLLSLVVPSLAAQSPAAAESGSMAGVPSMRPTPILDCSQPFAAFDYQPIVVQDYAELVDRLGEQAAAGNYCAQFDLAMMFLNGVGVQSDPERGRELLRAATDAGHADAQHTLGLMYEHGHHLERDQERALELYYEAGLSYLRWNNRRLALRQIDYIARNRPGHPFIQKLRDAIHDHWQQAQRMSSG